MTKRGKPPCPDWWPADVPEPESWAELEDLDGGIDCMAIGRWPGVKRQTDMIDRIISTLPPHLQTEAREGRVALRPELDPARNERGGQPHPGGYIRIKLYDGLYLSRWFRYDIPLTASQYRSVHPEDLEKVRPGQIPLGARKRPSQSKSD